MIKKKKTAEAPKKTTEKKEYDNTNTVVIFKTSAESLKENGKRAILWGRVNIDGVEYKMSLWKREGAKGAFYSGPVEPIEQEHASDDV